MELQTGIFAVKICELEKQYGKMQNRIRLCQNGDKNKIEKEIQKVKEEKEENSDLLKQRIRNSRLPAVADLDEAQLKYEESIQKIFGERMQESMPGDNDFHEKRAESKILYAEYSIDFAIQAMNDALYAALDAVHEELVYEEWRNSHE